MLCIQRAMCRKARDCKKSMTSCRDGCLEGWRTVTSLSHSSSAKGSHISGNDGNRFIV